eukprot:CAMPEP_0174710556 /NCGR_PEP_ID=MMETSP1094-20130205/12155_1 /TAXON_ID=156173 /ORGANISM="Chrysochromulina brevifilum, Strain UTEX LB 985" /LENGTH=175 /DNA_ID=CAMNT_0015909377 /DNA_START=192 /DNA_END=716 /DNA_ORIENTATION=-
MDPPRAIKNPAIARKACTREAPQKQRSSLALPQAGSCLAKKSAQLKTFVQRVVAAADVAPPTEEQRADPPLLCTARVADRGEGITGIKAMPFMHKSRTEQSRPKPAGVHDGIKSPCHAAICAVAVNQVNGSIMGGTSLAAIAERACAYAVESRTSTFLVFHMLGHRGIGGTSDAR